MTIIRYRDLTPADAPAISDLVVRTFTTFVAPDFEPLGVQSFRAYVTPTAIRKRLQASSFGRLAYADAVVAGVIEFRNGNHVTLLFVDEAYQRLGISRELMRQGIAMCRQRQPAIQQITVNSSTYAIPVYQRLGFEISAPEEQRQGIRATPMILNLDD